MSSSRKLNLLLINGVVLFGRLLSIKAKKAHRPKNPSSWFYSFRIDNTQQTFKNNSCKNVFGKNATCSYEKTLLYYKSWLLLIFHIIAFFETGVLKQSLYKHMVRKLKAFNYGL